MPLLQLCWLQILFFIVFIEAGLEKSRTKGLEKSMAKRVRGWQLEMESGRQVQRKGKALEKVHALENAEPNPSSLATRLLHLWGSGLLSATMIRELASLAMDHGDRLSEGDVGMFRMW